ncbi:MAG: bifunctional phosphopantothenoylcysteine decarboxylase/phosphopantothenate--cysteine ligase CoaBC [Candidatus Adiutrix sp.]|jgi:phosphopantothenoylcysteine decarboxylase/phosphopantothenate--cysteine ligase|nr:bifunctional phosphopantothenoylcysteine decarboxylase/phosphopantothenate--cysteine ligase CoaBC [Candidatus Adiutrix sp.]
MINPVLESGEAGAPAGPGQALALAAGRRLALVVTGGVAAYKAAELARLLTRAGALVRTVLTKNAARFITPLTFEALTGQPAYLSQWTRRGLEIEHVALADWAEAAVAAPATANFLAKMAHGLADDLASTFILTASGRPVLAAPAMNSRMLAAPATKANLETLAGRGVEIISPASGPLACGETGPGRLADPEIIALSAIRALTPKDFLGRRLAVTAGSTWESWDELRYLTNRSSGLMGRELALAAWLRGGQVTLVGGPAALRPPELPGLASLTAESTRDLLSALETLAYDVLIMAAAPADFRPAAPIAGKIKKERGPTEMPLALNPDILKSLPRRPGGLRVGFAAEDRDILERAQKKLAKKDLDLVAANEAGGPENAFAAAESRVRLIFRDGRIMDLGRRPKFAAAWAILDAVAALRAA